MYYRLYKKLNGVQRISNYVVEQIHSILTLSHSRLAIEQSESRANYVIMLCCKLLILQWRPNQRKLQVNNS